MDAGFQRRGGHHHQTREHEHQYHLVTRASGSKAESGGGGPGAAGRRAGREEELAGACRAQSAHGEAYADDEPRTGDGNDETDAGQNGKSRQLRQQQQPRRRALPHFDAAGLHLDGVVGVDREERVDRPEVERPAGGKWVDARPRPACSRERDDQRAAALHERAPREHRGHDVTKNVVCLPLGVK